MRCDFKKPVTINLDQFPHELLRSEDKFIVYQPPRQALEQTGTWMHVYCVLVFKGAIRACFLLKFGRVVEKASSKGFSNVYT